MGDRTYCTLNLAGVVTLEQARTLIHEINQEGPEDFALDEDDIPENGDLNDISFAEVNYAELPHGLETCLRAIGLSYSWSWDAGDEYPAGVEIYNAIDGSIENHVFADGQILISIETAQDPEKLAEASAAQDFLRQVWKIGTVIAPSAHAFIEALKTHPQADFLKAHDQAARQRARGMEIAS